MSDKSIEQEGESIFKSAELANVINTLQENYVVYLKQIILYNKLRKAKYDSLIKEGFTKEQSMEIITKVHLFS
jgi:hypothetical protein